jgi:peptidylprolyl isomerase
MKFPLLACALAAGIFALTAVCGPNSGNGTRGSVAYAAGAPDLSSVPNTTVVNGKTVKLKVMADGLRYYDIKLGTGAHPAVGQTVEVLYYGTLVDGTLFDASEKHGGTPIGFPIGVGQVIKGWDEGVPSMKIGGKRRLVIPASLGYGATGTPGGPVPPNATLIFDIVLVGAK